jgi:ATP-dependent DNA helicase 2 subunit 2
MGTCAVALEDCAKPEPKVTNSALISNRLRLGDCNTSPEEGIEIEVKTCKATALVRSMSMKKFAMREGARGEALQAPNQSHLLTQSQSQGGLSLPPSALGTLGRRTDYYVERKPEDGESRMDLDEEEERQLELVEDKEQLVKAYKYGATWVPCDDEGTLDKLPSKKGIDIVSFINEDLVRCPPYSSKALF